MPKRAKAAHDYEIHDQLRKDRARWNTLPFVGIQRGATGLSYVLELRNCTCGSTLGRRVAKSTEAPMKFEIYRDEAGEYRWRLLASTGQVVADSIEGYTCREDVHRDVHQAIVTLQASIVTARIVDA